MYQVSICPEDEILHINKKTIDQAKQCALDYYPGASFMEITSDHYTAIYDSERNHVGNIWPIK